MATLDDGATALAYSDEPVALESPPIWGIASLDTGLTLARLDSGSKKAWFAT